MDTELQYVDQGNGDTVVLVHGGFADYRLWGNLAGVLSRKFRVITYSRRGAYPNGPPTGKGGVSQHSADLASVVSQLSEAPAHIVGESYGALVATHFAIHNPDKILTLAIDEPPILSLLSDNSNDREELRRFDDEALKPTLAHFAHGRTEEAARVLIGFLEGSPEVYGSLPHEAKDAIAANSGAMFAELKAGFDGITRHELSRMKTPTLLMKSERGPKLLRRVVDILSETIPQWTLKEIMGTSHGTIVDSPEYSVSVLEFLVRYQR